MDDLSKILFLWIFCYLGCCSTMKKNNFINEILNDMFVMFFFFNFKLEGRKIYSHPDD